MFDFASTCEIADRRSTASFRCSAFGVVVDAGSTSIIFLQPTAAVKAASSASGFSASANAASSPPNGNGRAIGRLTIVGAILSSAKSAFVASRPAVFAGPRSQSTPPYPSFAASRALSAPPTPRVTAPLSETNIPPAALAGLAIARTAAAHEARSKNSRRVMRASVA